MATGHSSLTESCRGLARVSPTCRRRWKTLAQTGRDILTARGEGRSLTAAAWIALAALASLLPQLEELGSLTGASLLLFACLAAIALFDARYFVIPDGPLFRLGLCGLLTSFAAAPDEMSSRLLAAALGYGALRAVSYLYELLRGSAGVGEGDARLFAVAGLWLGLQGLPSCLIYAVLSALLSAVVALRRGLLESAGEPIPFGPHLALGFWLTWTFGPLELG